MVKIEAVVSRAIKGILYGSIASLILYGTTSLARFQSVDEDSTDFYRCHIHSTDIEVNQLLTILIIIAILYFAFARTLADLFFWAVKTIVEGETKDQHLLTASGQVVAFVFNSLTIAFIGTFVWASAIVTCKANTDTPKSGFVPFSSKSSENKLYFENDETVGLAFLVLIYGTMMALSPLFPLIKEFTKTDGEKQSSAKRSLVGTSVAFFAVKENTPAMIIDLMLRLVASILSYELFSRHKKEYQDGHSDNAVCRDLLEKAQDEYGWTAYDNTDYSNKIALSVLILCIIETVVRIADVVYCMTKENGVDTPGKLLSGVRVLAALHTMAVRSLLAVMLSGILLANRYYGCSPFTDKDDQLIAVVWILTYAVFFAITEVSMHHATNTVKANADLDGEA